MRLRHVAALAVSIVFTTMLIVPIATAHHKSGHDGGPPTTTTAPTTTTTTAPTTTTTVPPSGWTAPSGYEDCDGPFDATVWGFAPGTVYWQCTFFTPTDYCQALVWDGFVDSDYDDIVFAVFGGPHCDANPPPSPI